MSDQNRPSPFSAEETEKLKARIINGCDITPDCWEWIGCKLTGKGKGYGKLTVCYTTQYAHRMSFLAFNGYLPPIVMHLCNNPKCVRIDHLKGGTQAQNLAQMVAEGRGKRGEQHHKAKHTKAQVIDIKRALAAGLPPATVARNLGVKPHIVYDISKGRNWRHVKVG